MTPAIIVALIQALGPGALDLIELWMKDKNAVVTAQQWQLMYSKRNVPFSDVAGPK